MSARARGHAGTTWRRALALSVAVHAFLLLAVGIGAFTAGGGGRNLPTSTVGAGAVAPVEAATLVDLTSMDTVSPPEIVPPPEDRMPPDLSTAPFADQSHAAPASAASPPAGGPDRRRPAPDRGTGLGKTVEDPAWRRDATTLHERLSDGAEAYQPSHARTAGLATSPQAVRREPLTGIGDSTQSRRAQQAPVAASYGVADPEAPGLGVPTREGAMHATSAADDNPAVPQAGRTILAASQGPLNADQGTRSFDVEAPGFVAADDRAVRAASHEDHPGITDLTLAAVAGNGSEGRGPSDTPGAVARATTGQAPSPTSPHPLTRGTSGASGDDQRAQERRYDRYLQEIGARVEKERVFPLGLKLRLEQGDTLLHFVVLPDGRLGDTIQVVKSSGFAEFDQAALDAVRKASPFRPMPGPGRARPLGVTLRVGFPNPVIR